MANYTMEEIKQIIRSIAISGTSAGMSVKGLVQDFKKMEGYDLPYQRLGFRSADDFLRSLPDTVTVQGYGTSALVEPVVTKSNQHIRDMVQLSKTNSRRRPYKNNYVIPANRASNNNYGRSNGQFYAKSGDNNGLRNRTNYNRPANSTYDAVNHDVPRKVSNREYDFLDTADINESESSDEGPKFVVTEDKKLAQVKDSMQKIKISSPPNSRSEEAIPDNVLRLINSVEIPEDAMNLTDTIRVASIPESVIPKKSVQIYVTEVHNPNRVWFHFKENAETIAELMNELDVYYSYLEGEEWRLKPSNVVVGFYCAALFLGMWHRAKIVEDLRNNKIKVFFIDYGTVSFMELKDVKFLAKCFRRTPAQSMRASLAYVKPVGHWWTHEASWELLSLVSEKILHAYVVDVDRKDNFMDVVLVDNTKAKDRIINQQLSTKGHAIWEQDQSYEEKSTETFRSRAKSFWELFPRFEEIESGEYPTLVELGESLSTGFNFEQYFILSLYDDEPYLKHILTKAVAVDPSVIVNADSEEYIDYTNYMKVVESSQPEDDDGFCQVPSILEIVPDQSAVIDDSHTQVVPEVKDTVTVPVLKPKKQVTFVDPEYVIIPMYEY
ncbi:RING finger protein 17 isoform X2 [Ochlerotatus camptorhynchus]|uniref:RING finger protein 17 isoform X2 n=1 Tax=Ochlerotatus camptorhynchus TaxID=644619 RepID=UPI0031D13C14